MPNTYIFTVESMTANGYAKSSGNYFLDIPEGGGVTKAVIDHVCEDFARQASELNGQNKYEARRTYVAFFARLDP